MKEQEKRNLETKKKKQRVIPGYIVEISINKEYYVYAQILHNSKFAFFDYKTPNPISDIAILTDAPVLFIVCVYNYVINQNIWKIVGKLPIRDNLKVLPLSYVYDVHHDSFSTYDNNTGEMKPATKEEVRGLECAAVWAENHIEDRIRDYYNKVPCIWLKEHYLLFPESKP